MLLREMQVTFGCKRRAAQDALHILIEGGWLERRNDETDRRRKRYFVTEQGERDLLIDAGWRAMRLARWKYSSTSTRARKMRRRVPTHHLLRPSRPSVARNVQPISRRSRFAERQMNRQFALGLLPTGYGLGN
jgi:hypothetical protein